MVGLLLFPSLPLKDFAVVIGTSKLLLKFFFSLPLICYTNKAKQSIQKFWPKWKFPHKQTHITLSLTNLPPPHFLPISLLLLQQNYFKKLNTLFSTTLITFIIALKNHVQHKLLKNHKNTFNLCVWYKHNKHKRTPACIHDS